MLLNTWRSIKTCRPCGQSTMFVNTAAHALHVHVQYCRAIRKISVYMSWSFLNSHFWSGILAALKALGSSNICRRRMWKGLGSTTGRHNRHALKIQFPSETPWRGRNMRQLPPPFKFKMVSSYCYRAKTYYTFRWHLPHVHPVVSRTMLSLVADAKVALCDPDMSETGVTPSKVKVRNSSTNLSKLRTSGFRWATYSQTSSTTEGQLFTTAVLETCPSNCVLILAGLWKSTIWVFYLTH